MRESETAQPEGMPRREAGGDTLNAIASVKPCVRCGSSFFFNHSVAQRNTSTLHLTAQTLTARCRMAKFSLVGAIGIFVQLEVLYILTAIRTNYLVATVFAVEAAIVHNFIWHRFFTWPDRLGSFAQTSNALLRFNLSNGLVSLAGNLLLMRFFSGQLHLPLLMANLITVLICALANFAISDHWVFDSRRNVSQAKLSIAPASAPESAAQRGDR